MSGLLRSMDPGDGLSYDFIEQLAFNATVGNADAHAKNYSVFLDAAGVRLTPLYDAITTTYWTLFDHDLGIPIGGARHVGEPTPVHWAKLARETDLDEDRVVGMARDMAGRLIDCSSEAYANLPATVRDRLQRSLVKAGSQVRMSRQ